MTKLDFSAIKDARVGSTKIQRIYRGNNKVWNRYCWEKWGCNKRETYTYTDVTSTSSSVGKITEKNYSSSISSINSLYTSYKWYSDSEGFTGSPVLPLTVKIENSVGYYTVSYDNCTVKKIIGVEVREDGGHIVRFETVAVAKRTVKSTYYVKNSTSYGLIEGSKGDYPDDGRHSDGYWYVRAAPIGVKEE